MGDILLFAGTTNEIGDIAQNAFLDNATLSMLEPYIYGLTRVLLCVKTKGFFQFEIIINVV